MTREEAIIEAGIEYSIQNSPYCIGGDNFYERARELNRNKSFEAGVIWADKNPKSPWISVKDDLPCNHEEMVHINPLDRFDQRTSWCIVSDGRFISMDRMYNFTDFTDDWKWGTKLHNVKYWSPLPKIPKE